MGLASIQGTAVEPTWEEIARLAAEGLTNPEIAAQPSAVTVTGGAVTVTG